MAPFDTFKGNKDDPFIPTYSQNIKVFHPINQTYSQNKKVFPPVSQTYLQNKEVFDPISQKYLQNKEVFHLISQTYSQYKVFHPISQTYSQNKKVIHPISQTYSQNKVFHPISQTQSQNKRVGWAVPFPLTSDFQKHYIVSILQGCVHPTAILVIKYIILPVRTQPFDQCVKALNNWPFLVIPMAILR